MKEHITFPLILCTLLIGCSKKENSMIEVLKNTKVEFSSDGGGGCAPELIQLKDVRRLLQQPEIWKTLIDNLASPIPTKSVFEGKTIPVGYLCLDILLKSVHPDYRDTVHYGFGDDGLWTDIREEYYFPPDILETPQGKDKMLDVQKAWLKFYGSTQNKVWYIKDHPLKYCPADE